MRTGSLDPWMMWNGGSEKPTQHQPLANESFINQRHKDVLWPIASSMMELGLMDRKFFSPSIAGFMVEISCTPAAPESETERDTPT